ncbi:hypothetical protein BAE44_0023442 [Dichanthelium oligosanthes]|uniref:KIB1-4 beta-propeller domain-containing protein n=1 Tax=Dichanthelium oligosanthes TaxID=888268 RepID=A0A1E5URL5_9POAL|nr:hypothetical protein BAE44_0023442 [Dichanthelium oligosanthes]
MNKGLGLRSLFKAHRFDDQSPSSVRLLNTAAQQPPAATPHPITAGRRRRGVQGWHKSKAHRRVCRAWRFAARQCRLPSPSPAPWLVLPGGDVISLPHGETFQLPEGVRFHGSCGEWLLLSWNDGSCFLMNPFTKATMSLPRMSSYSYYEEPVEVDEDDMDPDINHPGTWMDNMERGGEISVISLVVCTTRLIAAIAVVGSLGAIALCRTGAAAWSVSAHGEYRWLSHIVMFQGKLYALDNNTDDLEDLIAIEIVDEHDSDQPRVSRIEHLIEGAYLPRQPHSVRMHYSFTGLYLLPG